MNEEEIAVKAYKNEPLESSTPPERLLWYELRDVYAAFRSGQITKDQGSADKTDAVNRFRAYRDTLERATKFYQTIEPCGIAYAESNFEQEAGVRFFKVAYGLIHPEKGTEYE